MDAQALERPPRLVQARVSGLQYFLEHHAGSLIILTNAGQAAREYTLMACPLAQCDRRCHALVGLGQPCR